jgi:putative addiction module killer protein
MNRIHDRFQYRVRLLRRPGRAVQQVTLSRHWLGLAGNARRFVITTVAGARVVRSARHRHRNHLSNVKSVGEGVLEYKIDFGPGYRVYFGRDGNTLVILLTGGTKKRQQRDIGTAIGYWRDYKQGRRTVR